MKRWRHKSHWTIIFIGHLHRNILLAAETGPGGLAESLTLVLDVGVELAAEVGRHRVARSGRDATVVGIRRGQAHRRRTEQVGVGRAVLRRRASRRLRVESCNGRRGRPSVGYSNLLVSLVNLLFPIRDWLGNENGWKPMADCGKMAVPGCCWPKFNGNCGRHITWLHMAAATSRRPIWKHSESKSIERWWWNQNAWGTDFILTLSVKS